MPATFSPLRYPGGKSQLYSYVKEIIEYNSLQEYTYVEPFAGGAGLALKLLFHSVVPSIIINDFDPGIYAFWYSCINNPDELCELVRSRSLDIDEWTRQKTIYSTGDSSNLLDLGFATLYLNRTNRSGIVKGGVLGGKGQSGKYKMDVRFNRNTLVKKICDIAERRDNIRLTNYDAKYILSGKCGLDEHSFLNIDPPYVKKGKQLYRSYFLEKDHRELSRLIADSSYPWIVTYDECDLVKEMYGDFRCSRLDIRYSANIKRNAHEYIFFSDNLKIPNSIELI